MILFDGIESVGMVFYIKFVNEYGTQVSIPVSKPLADLFSVHLGLISTNKSQIVERENLEESD